MNGHRGDHVPEQNPAYRPSATPLLHFVVTSFRLREATCLLESTNHVRLPVGSRDTPGHFCPDVRFMFSFGAG